MGMVRFIIDTASCLFYSRFETPIGKRNCSHRRNYQEEDIMFYYRSYLKRLQSGDSSSNPFLDFLDMKLEEIREGYARFCMPIRPEYMQCNGVMQGGLIVAMADETIAHAIMTLLGSREEIATVELKNNFIAPVKEGTLTAEATIFKKGRSIVVGDCIVVSDGGKVISRSSATFLICQG
jgi:acyl-CoA thioesterase